MHAFIYKKGRRKERKKRKREEVVAHVTTLRYYQHALDGAEPDANIFCCTTTYVQLMCGAVCIYGKHAASFSYIKASPIGCVVKVPTLSSGG